MYQCPIGDVCINLIAKSYIFQYIYFVFSAQLEWEYHFFQSIFNDDQHFRASYTRLTAYINKTFFDD